MSIARDVLSSVLVLSGLLGAQILVYDKWLWSTDPSHAYGLVGFAVVDLALATLVLWRAHFAIIAAGTLATVQFGAMLADAVAGQPMGVSSDVFRSYLLSDYSFVALLIIQVSIVIVALGSLMMPIIREHVHRTGVMQHRKY